MLNINIWWYEKKMKQKQFNIVCEVIYRQQKPLPPLTNKGLK